MAKKFIKTIYVTEQKNPEAKKIPQKIDLYETDCFVIYEVTTIENQVYTSKDKKGTEYFEKYSRSKKYLDTEFDQSIADEFQRQFTEYRKKVAFDMEQTKARKDADTRIRLLSSCLCTMTEMFKGDWVVLAKKIGEKIEEIEKQFEAFLGGF